MQIQSDIFIGVYNQRRAVNSEDAPKLPEEKKAVFLEQAKLAVQQVKQLYGKEASLAISKGAQDFLFSEEGYDRMRQDIEDLYQKNVLQQKELMQDRTDDPFWGNTGNQWLIFSEALYNTGFYDDMTDEEVNQMETMLAKITAGMDHLSRSQYQTGISFSDYYGHGANFFMGSAEAALELESATAALGLFGELYVGEDRKEAFAQLVDKFHAHNEEILEGYQSPFESFQKAVSRMHQGAYANSAVNSRHNQGMAAKNSNINAAIYLGGITHSEQEKETYKNNLFELFQKMAEKNSSAIWKSLEDMFLDFASGNAADESIRSYVEEQSRHTLTRIRGYWAELTNEQ